MADMVKVREDLAVMVEDSRVMPDLDMVCPDCKADVGEACHPDCSTFWTEEE